MSLGVLQMVAMNRFNVLEGFATVSLHKESKFPEAVRTIRPDNQTAHIQVKSFVFPIYFTRSFVSQHLIPVFKDMAGRGLLF